MAGPGTGVEPNLKPYDRRNTEMFETPDLTGKSDEELVAMMTEYMRLEKSLAHAASEKFKQSESAEWDADLCQEALDLMREAERLSEESVLVAEEAERRLGPSDNYGAAQFREGKPWQNDQRWHREDLTTQTVPQSRDIDEMLPQALENLLSVVSPSWWVRQQSLVNEEQRKTVTQPLLLCGRERWPMGFPALHKFANYLLAARDHLAKEPFLDTYTAARAIASICTLGLSLEILRDVKGADSKLRDLYRKPDAATDSIIFELLVAAAFARMGHDVSFIDETPGKKTPGLRLYGKPMPIVIECKRRQPLNDYEKREFSVIREVFAQLCAERKELGLFGELTIDFTSEIVNLPAAGIIKSVRDVTDSLSPYAAKETQWGTIRLRPVEVSQKFERTRLYSPDFLERVFGTDLEMDEFDGICAVAANNSYPEVERAELPFLLKWTSNSPAAQARKLQTIKTLWVEAVNQIPTGEAGLIYLAYEEGHRPSLANARTDAIRELTKTIYFERRAIYISLTVVSRLFLNVVHEGRPDFIESSIPLAEGDNDNYDFWTQEMPTRLFTF